MSVLSELRSQPSHVKSRIALVSALVVTGIIGAIWSSTVPVRFLEAGKGLSAASREADATQSGFTDLVEEAKKMMAPPDTPGGAVEADATTADANAHETALDLLHENGSTPLGSASPSPTPTSTGEQVVDQEPAPSHSTAPRVILIGTTTRGAP